MNRDLIPRLDSLIEHLSGWIGSLVELTEQVTRLPGTFDRHFTTSSRFVMRLECVGITFSGTSLSLDGKAGDRPASYQATCDLLEALTIGPREVVFLERFGQVVERRSVFKLLGEGQSTAGLSLELECPG